MRRHLAPALSLALLAAVSGCVTKKVRKALEEDSRASLTVSGDEAVLAAVRSGLGRFEDVKATFETVEKGVEVVRLVAAYAELMEALTWLVAQNLRLIANDEVTRSLLAAVLK
ncbi:MAG: hypothetical protein L6Q95_04990 [Planctomycetes bacterium]|nr:hypothetical protein [Planctomycetota bacterium]